jgi:hypothetical protein
MALEVQLLGFGMKRRGIGRIFSSEIGSNETIKSTELSIDRLTRTHAVLFCVQREKSEARNSTSSSQLMRLPQRQVVPVSQPDRREQLLVDAFACDWR